MRLICGYNILFSVQRGGSRILQKFVAESIQFVSQEGQHMNSENTEQHTSIGMKQLPRGTAQAIRKKCRRAMGRNIIKTLIFYAVSMTILFLTERSNDLFTREAQPV